MLPSIVMEAGVVNEPELRFTPSGVAVAKVRVVAKDRKRDSNGNWSDGDPCFLTVTAWRQQAEYLCESAEKGSTLLIVGRLAMREWETDDGQKRTSYEVQAESIALSLRWNAARKVEVERAAAPAPRDSWSESQTTQEGEPPF